MPIVAADKRSIAATDSARRCRVVDLLTDPGTATTCLWVHGALSCGDDSLRDEFAAQRAAGLAELRTRFKRAVAAGDLPQDSDSDTLEKYVQTVNFGLTVQESTG